MRVIVHPRQGGKSRDLILLSAITGIPIMTFRERIPFIETFARDKLRLLIPKPIPYPSVHRFPIDEWDRRSPCRQAVLLDDAGEWIKSLLYPYGFDPFAAALTQEGDVMEDRNV